MARVAFVSPVFPFPTDDGKKAMLAGMVRFLCREHGAEDVHFLWIAARGPAETPPELPFRIHRLGRPGPMRQAATVLGDALLRRRRSLQEAALFAPSVGRELNARLTEIGPDLVVCDTVRTGQYFAERRPVEAVWIQYLDDLFSIRYARMLETLERLPDSRLDPLGNFRHLIPAPLHGLLKAPRVQRAMLGFERDRIRASEDRLVHAFDRNLLINPDEAALLRRRTGLERIRSIPPVLPQPDEPPRRDPGDPPRFVFLGALNIPHNRVSLERFLRTQLDAVRARLPSARVVVVGRGVDDALAALLRSNADVVEHLGFVEDLDDLFRRCTAMIVPLVFGSGVKIKTLEAMSRGLPVVSTPFGTEGIPVTHGRDCLVLDTLDDFPAAMERVSDPQTNHAMSEAAFRFFLGTYGARQVESVYRDLFRPGTEPTAAGSG